MKDLLDLWAVPPRACGSRWNHIVGIKYIRFSLFQRLMHDVSNGICSAMFDSDLDT